MTLFPRERVVARRRALYYRLTGRPFGIIYITTKSFDGVTNRTIKHSVQYNDNRDFQLVITK